jgi:hypothetical protein
MTDRAPAAHLRGEFLLQQPGSCRFENTLESLFYDRPIPPFEYSWGETTLIDLQEVFLVGDHAQIFFPDGRFFLPCTYPDQQRLHLIKVRRPIPFLARRVEIPLFHLTGRNHENKGHFVLQHLPRLLLARSWLEKNSDYRILVAPGHARWQKHFLRLAGLPDDRIMEGTQGTWRARRVLYVPMFYGTNGLGPPEHYREIRDRAAGLERSAPPSPARSIFVTRRDAPDKRLLNEDEIIGIARAILGELDVFEFKGQTLESQIVAFRRAPVILGPIGQGICNVIFAEGRVLVTLAPGTEASAIYETGHGTQLALLCGNQAITFYNGEAGESRSNWHFPPERFRAMLTRLVQLPGLKHLGCRKGPSHHAIHAGK